MLDISSLIMRHADGSLDMDTTMGFVQDAIEAHEAKLSADSERLEKAAREVFAKYPGACLNLAALTTGVVATLGVSLTDIGMIKDRLSHLVNANPAFEVQARGRNAGIKLAAVKVATA